MNQKEWAKKKVSKGWKDHSVPYPLTEHIMLIIWTNYVPLD